MAKYADLTLLFIDNQHLFLQCHAANFIPASGDETDESHHPPPQICIVSHSNVKLGSVFYMKVYVWCTEPFRKKLD